MSELPPVGYWFNPMEEEFLWVLLEKADGQETPWMITEREIYTEGANPWLIFNDDDSWRSIGNWIMHEHYLDAEFLDLKGLCNDFGICGKTMDDSKNFAARNSRSCTISASDVQDSASDLQDSDCLQVSGLQEVQETTVPGGFDLGKRKTNFKDEIPLGKRPRGIPATYYGEVEDFSEDFITLDDVLIDIGVLASEAQETPVACGSTDDYQGEERKSAYEGEYQCAIPTPYCCSSSDRGASG